MSTAVAPRLSRANGGLGIVSASAHAVNGNVVEAHAVLVHVHLVRCACRNVLVTWMACQLASHSSIAATSFMLPTKSPKPTGLYLSTHSEDATSPDIDAAAGVMGTPGPGVGVAMGVRGRDTAGDDKARTGVAPAMVTEAAGVRAAALGKVTADAVRAGTAAFDKGTSA